MSKQIIILVILTIKANAQVYLDGLADVSILSELPLERLLKVRESFDYDLVTAEEPLEDLKINASDTFSNETSTNNITSDQPEALPLKQSKINRRKHIMLNRGYQHDGDDDDEHHRKTNKKSIQSIFQMSVTTLAFLAFGGYLLCLIVQALKNKQQNTVVVMVTTMAPARRRRKKKKKRRRRPGYIRNKRSDKSVNDFEEESRPILWPPSANADSMFEALASLSEAYTFYHTTVDYAKFNYTLSNYPYRKKN